MKKIIPWKINPHLIYLLIFLLFLFLFRNLEIVPGDDIIFKSSLNNQSIFSWMTNFYQMWSGRIVLTTFLVVLLNQNILIIKLFNALFATLLLYSMDKLSNDSNKLMNKMLVFSFFILIPEKYISSTVFWFTGSINYLWPIASLFYLLFILYKIINDNSKITLFTYVSASILSILASNSEQTAIVLMTFLIIFLFLNYIQERRVNFFVLYIFLLATVTTLITFLSPGNVVRLNAEILSLNPSFNLLSVVDKLYIGLNFTSNVLFNDFEYHLLFLSFALLFINRVDKKNGLFVSLLPIIIIFIRVFFNWLFVFLPYCTQCNDINYILFNFRYFEVFYLAEIDHLIPLFLSIVVYISISLNILYCNFIKKSERIFLTLLFISAILSSIIIGFSPTIEASGNRIYLYMIVVLIVLVLFFINKLEFKVWYFDIKYILMVLILLRGLQIYYNYSQIIDYMIVY